MARRSSQRRSLNGVGVQHGLRSCSSQQCGDLGEIRDRADLVVDRHHADERYVVERVGQRVEVDPTHIVDTDHATVTGLDGVQHGVMLDSGAQRDTTRAVEGAEDRRVVGFGATTREDHFAGPATDHVGDVVACLVDRLADLPGEAVRPRRIRELLGEERQHCLDRVGTHRRRCRMIEVGVAVVHGVQANGVRPLAADSGCGRGLERH